MLATIPNVSPTCPIPTTLVASDRLGRDKQFPRMHQFKQKMGDSIIFVRFISLKLKSHHNTPDLTSQGYGEREKKIIHMNRLRLDK